MARTIKEWKSYYTEAPATPAERVIESLSEKVARQACQDVQEICIIAEQLQAENEQAVKLLRHALPEIKCVNHYQNGLINAIGEFLQALQEQE